MYLINSYSSENLYKKRSNLQVEELLLEDLRRSPS